MKRLITVLTILIGTSSFAQDTMEKTIGEFHELKFYDIIEFKIVKSNDNRVVI